MIHSSRQSPKPRYCDVVDTLGNKKFQLYFDGGPERKLQIRGLEKSWCTVYAEWSFETGLSETDSLLS